MDPNLETAAVLALLKGIRDREAKLELPPGEYNLDGCKVWVELGGKVTKEPDGECKASLGYSVRFAALVGLVEMMRKSYPSGMATSLDDMISKAIIAATTLPVAEQERLEGVMRAATKKAEHELPVAKRPRAGALRAGEISVDIEVLKDEK